MNKQKKSVITTDFNVLTKKLFHKKSKIQIIQKKFINFLIGINLQQILMF